MILHGPESSASIDPRSYGRRFCARNGDRLSSFVARYSFEGSLSRRFRPCSGVTSGTSDWLWGWLLSESKRSSAGHAWSNNRRRGRGNNNSLSAFVSWNISKRSRQSLFGKRTTWARGFLLHWNTSPKGSSLRGAGNYVWFSVGVGERSSLERRSRSFGSTNGGWVCSGRVWVPYLGRCGLLERSQNGGIH